MPKEVHKFGLVTGFNTGTTVIAVGGLVPYVSAPGQLTAVSTSDQDADGGSGTPWIRVIGLFLNATGQYIEFEKDFELNGQVGVTPTSSLIDLTKVYRIFRGHVLSEGFIGPESNVGDIDLKIGGVSVARISATRGQTEVASFSTGSLQRGRMRGWDGALINDSGATARADFRVMKRKFGGPWRIADPRVIGSLNADFDKKFAGEGKVVEFEQDYRVIATHQSGTMTISAGMTFRLTSDDQPIRDHIVSV